MTDAAVPAETAELTETTLKRYLCRHIHTSGRRCGSPALRGEHFCYYHHTTRRPAPRHHGVHPDHAIFELPAIDDRAGVQFALAQILNRIASDQLDHKRSGRLLHGLFIASRNLPRDPRPAARSDSRCDSRSSRHASSRESDSPSGPSAPGALVEEIILDTDLGPIAPVAELPPPQDPEEAAEDAAEAHRRAFALFLQENCFPAQPPETLPTPTPNPTDPLPLTTDHSPTVLPILHACIEERAQPAAVACSSLATYPLPLGSRNHSTHAKRADSIESARRSLPETTYLAATAFAAPAFSASALSVASQVKSLPSRPKCP